MAFGSWLPMFELLVRFGIEENIAEDVAKNELYQWEVSEVIDVLSRVHRPTRQFTYFGSSAEEFAKWRESRRKRSPGSHNARKPTQQPLSFDFRGWWASMFLDRDEWISPPRPLIELSAKEGKALCINKNLHWQLRADNYVALSHVWIEGLQRDEHRGGLSLEKLRRIFELLKEAKIDAEWIWTDSLVIPGGGAPAASLQDEILTVDVINTMKQVYERATSVIIIDALVLQLRHRSLHDIAVALILGRWRSRMWTFQESLLAKEAVIITASGTCTLRDLVSFVRTKKESEKRYHRMWLKLAIMSRSTVPLTVPDIAVACKIRRAGVDVDYARALYGLLDLKWEYGMTREQGMQRIYYSQKHQASRILFNSGAPRLKIRPAWAPSTLAGLEGRNVPSSRWESRGISGKWHIYKIKSLKQTFVSTGRLALEFEMHEGPDSVMQCATNGYEESQTIEGFKKVVEHGDGYVVSPLSLQSKQPSEFATTVLLVQRMKTEAHEGFEVTVHIAVIKTGLTCHTGVEQAMLIRHDGPGEHGELMSALIYGMNSQRERNWPKNLPKRPGESQLHAAVRSGDIFKVNTLLDLKEPIETYDDRGWTPIHIAAVRGEESILRLLCAQGGSVDVKSEKQNQTPLSLVASEGQEDIVPTLIQEGADIHVRDDLGNTPIMLALMKAGRSKMVEMLLAQGANPNDQTKIESPLQLACSRGDFSSTRLLVEAGAEVNRRGLLGTTPLHEAAEWGTAEQVRYLLEHGADPNARNDWKANALRRALTGGQYALEGSTRSIEAVKILVEFGSDRNMVYQGGWTAVHSAVNSKNWEMLQVLLSKEPRCDIDRQLDDGKWTPLHMAILDKQRTMVKFLLEYGADPFLANAKGYTALDMAKASTDEAIQQIVINSTQK